MSLYVSGSANLLVQIRAEEQLYTPKGDKAGKTKRLFAQFERGGVPDWGWPEVLERIEFRGIGDQEKWTRIGVFDSVEAQKRYGWSDEERVEVETYLEGHTVGNNFIRLEMPQVEKPWPKIESLRPIGRRSAEQSVELLWDTIENTGVDADTVLLYLKQEAWPEPVVEGLRGKVAESHEDDPVEELVEA